MRGSLGFRNLITFPFLRRSAYLKVYINTLSSNEVSVSNVDYENFNFQFRI